jgi:hypothetical protein
MRAKQHAVSSRVMPKGRMCANGLGRPPVAALANIRQTTPRIDLAARCPAGREAGRALALTSQDPLDQPDASQSGYAFCSAQNQWWMAGKEAGRRRLSR